MKIHQLTDVLSVSPQLNVADIDQVLAAGFKTVICNRPDNEGDDQQDSDSIRIACEAKGLQWHYMPVSPKDYSDEQALEFGRLLNNVALPVLAFCRTGTRCTNLWALSQASEQNVADIIIQANEAGYDIAKLGDRISALKG